MSEIGLLLLFSIASPMAVGDVDFSHDIVPILQQHCAKCHTGDQKKGGLSFNTRESTLLWGESGKVLIPGNSVESELIRRLTSDDVGFKMPPEGPPVPFETIALLKSWIDAGMPWERGFTFGPRGYEPPLQPRAPELPPVIDGRTHPVDRLIDTYLVSKSRSRPLSIDDATFFRRIHLDLVGLLPQPQETLLFLLFILTQKHT